MDQNQKPGAANGLDNIKRVVVLMFENRSFDHLFGDFTNANGLRQQDGSFKGDCYNLEHPLKPPAADNPRYFPTEAPVSTPLPHDFTHDFGDGMMPDLFGPIFTVEGTPPAPQNPDAIYISGYTRDKGPVGGIFPTPQTYPPTNSGFYSTYNNNQQQTWSVLTYFKKGTLKVLHTLAEEFVLCDNWYCDMPGHTLPNRAFVHCGTTGLTGIDDTDGGMVTEPCIFDLIDRQSGLKQPPGWNMYAPVDSFNNMGQLDTRFLNDSVKSCTGIPITQFATDCKNKKLPLYSFIMCWLPSSTVYTDTSMHPNSMMQPGENLLASVYNALRNSPCWDDTLLVITFDENGGIYDHVFPPTTTPPYEGALPATQHTRGACLNSWYLDSTFDFSLLGPRVPALLISPWLSKGIDSTQYQNTSILRFVIDRMNALYGTKAGALTERDAHAPSLEAAFNQYSQTTMRTDCPEWIEPYPALPNPDPATSSDKIPYADGQLVAWTPPPGTEAAPPVPYIDELMNIYVSPLPGHPDSGKKIARNFPANADVDRYGKERLQAAEAYWQAEGKDTATRPIA